MLPVIMMVGDANEPSAPATLALALCLSAIHDNQAS